MGAVISRGGRGKIFCVTGPSGAGKSTLINEVMPRINGLVKIPSYTTREPGARDREGIDYYRVTADEFLSLRDQGVFLEHFEVYGNLYGTSALRYNEALSKGLYPIKDIDTKGAFAIKEKFGEDAVTVYVKVPSLSELQQRVLNRDGKISKDRISQYEYEESQADKCDYIIVNSDLSLASSALEEIIRKNM